MAERSCKCLKNREVCGVLDVQNPAGLFRLIILIEPNVPQCLDDLGIAIVNAVRLADERDDRVASSSFVEHDFRMAGGNDLRALLRCHLDQEIIPFESSTHSTRPST